jgi:hypothetical protein
MHPAELPWAGFAIFTLLVLTGGVAGALPAGTTHPAALTEDSPRLTNACATVIAADPGVNSSLFLEVCESPDFVIALQQWGVDNFSYGTGVDQGWASTSYSIVWLTACSNLTWAGEHCVEEEGWFGNVSSGTITGPTFLEYPAVCTGCLSLAPRGTVAGVFSVATGASVGLLMAIITFVRRPGIAPPPNSPVSGLNRSLPPGR